MPRAYRDGSKSKTARRIIEVLEFFDEEHKEATVMDIVRRYKRPQSSTSELLSTLVELGLLYRDSRARNYSLTPRAAILGSVSQPELIRHGTLTKTIDILAQQGLSLGLFGLIEMNTQIFRWTRGSNRSAYQSTNLRNGSQDHLSDSAVGLLLLSTIEQSRRAGMLRRLNAEAPEDRKFNPAIINQQLQDASQRGYIVGGLGFGSDANVAAVLVPNQPAGRPLAIGFVYKHDQAVDPASLIASIRAVISQSDEQGLREVVLRAA